MKLDHTHESGGDCLACDVERLRNACKWWHSDDAPGSTLDVAALDRIEAALAERAHLERIAQVFCEWAAFAGFDSPGTRDAIKKTERDERIQECLNAERTRKGTR